MQIVDVFRARIVDVTNNSLIIEITGDEEKIEGFVEVCVRSGSSKWCAPAIVAMARGSHPAATSHGNGNGNGTLIKCLRMMLEPAYYPDTFKYNKGEQ